ncbi:Phosphate transport system permease protein PstA 1 [invertebrate metagenome]|uniref:Phosphate transport system permease protein PstA 1 n=1 Tax=invertebrate metagenome TaxID=1711999 RepID=A0A2H9TBZ5_9ZZZZ
MDTSMANQAASLNSPSFGSHSLRIPAGLCRKRTMRIWQDKILMSLILLATAATFSMLAWILWHIVSNGIRYVDWNFLTSGYSRMAVVSGIWPMIVSTLYMVALSLLIALPAGIMGAIYLTEYAPAGSRTVRVIRFTTESLAGIPSIIYGLFGLTLFVTVFGFSILSGGLTLAIVILPVVIRTTEEAMISVPMAYREGSYALGASRLYTISRLILPNALPGIVTGIILCIGRIIGESAPVFLTAGMVARIPDSVLDSGRTLTVHLYKLTQELFSASEWHQAYATATVLIVIVFTLNVTTRLIARWCRRIP